MTPPSLNAKIAVLQIRRQAQLVKGEDAIARRILALWAEVEQELIATLAGIDPSGSPRTSTQQARVTALLEEAQRILNGGFAGMQAETADRLGSMVSRELGWASDLNDAIGVDLLSVRTSAERARAIVSDHMVDGAPSAEWWAKQEADTLIRFRTAMGKGMFQGESLGQLVARVREEVSPYSRHNAESLVRTSWMQAANDSHMAVFEANQDVLDGVQWLATLDLRSCSRCGALDGKAWDFNKKPIGHDKPFQQAPLHFRCRCCMSPLLKSWEDLVSQHGGNKRLAKALDSMPPGTRSSMNGQIPSSVDYANWESE